MNERDVLWWPSIVCESQDVFWKTLHKSNAVWTDVSKINKNIVFIVNTGQEAIGLCPVCHITYPLLNSCCFNFCSGLNHPVTGSIWWPVQPQEQIALLHWSQRTVAANKSWLHSDPVCGCLRARVFVYLCVSVLVRMTPSDMFPIRKWKPLWDFFSPPLQWANSFITLPALPRATCCALMLQPAPRQASAASILRTEVLSGYYFWADHIKTTAIKHYWNIWLCLLWGGKRSEREMGKKAEDEWMEEERSPLVLLNRKIFMSVAWNGEAQ